jgi:hypothetical protein
VPSPPDRRELSLRTGGGIVPVGLPLGRPILLQEYHTRDASLLAIANASREPVTLGISEWRGSIGRPLLPARVLPARTLTNLPVDDLCADPGLSLLAVLVDGESHGLIRAPRRPDLQELAAGLAVTTEGLNSIGSRDARMVLAQRALVFRGGEQSTLSLHYPADLGSVSVSRQSDAAKGAAVLGVHAAGGRVDEHRDRYEIRADGSSSEAAVTIEVRMPVVTHPTLATVSLQVTSSAATGFVALRGFAVEPARD